MYIKIDNNVLTNWANWAFDGSTFIDIDYDYYSAQKDKFKVINGALVDISETPEYLEAQALKKTEQLARLKMTKLDFFKYVVSPTGTTYSQLLTAVGSDELLQATWDLCNHVYRGDTVLNTYVTQFLGVTPKQLDDVFIEYGE